VSSIFLGKI